MHPSEESHIYELKADSLPNDGLYEVQAILTGTGKNKKTETYSSQKVKYLLKKPASEVALVAVEKEKDNEKDNEVNFDNETECVDKENTNKKKLFLRRGTD